MKYSLRSNCHSISTDDAHYELYFLSFPILWYTWWRIEKKNKCTDGISITSSTLSYPTHLVLCILWCTVMGFNDRNSIYWIQLLSDKFPIKNCPLLQWNINDDDDDESLIYLGTYFTTFSISIWKIFFWLLWITPWCPFPCMYIRMWYASL